MSSSKASPTVSVNENLHEKPEVENKLSVDPAVSEAAVRSPRFDGGARAWSTGVLISAAVILED